LSAFELSSEHYRMKFREMKKPVMIITLSLHFNCKAVSNGGYRVWIVMITLRIYDKLLWRNSFLKQFLLICVFG